MYQPENKAQNRDRQYEVEYVKDIAHGVGRAQQPRHRGAEHPYAHEERELCI